MSMQKVETEMPWWDSTKWKKGVWYPMPFGYHARNYPGYIMEGYGIWQLEDYAETDPLFGDIERALPGAFVFSDALAICEAHNGFKFEDSGDEAQWQNQKPTS